MKICEYKNCSGCFACYNICPKKAITMYEDKYGHIYPKIDEAKCVKCNLCKNTCPANDKQMVFNYPIKCFASYSKNKDIHKNSSSGGMAYEFAKHIVQNKGVVYAVSSYFDCEHEIGFIRIDDINELNKIQGSKYLHAHVKDSYVKIKKDLNNDVFVLFIGTPCQVSGLKKFLKKEYLNLVTIDIICHGTPSQKMLLEEINNPKIDYVNFRGKHGFTLIAKQNEKVLYKKNKYESDYYFSFLKGWTYRDSCYSCKYAQPSRVSDITIGDFWGNEKHKNKNGLSVILINTSKGNDFLNKIDSIQLFEEDIEKAIKGNSQLVSPTFKSDNVNKFREYYNKNYNFHQSIKKIIGKNYLTIKFKGKLKKIKDLVIR